MDIAPPPKCGLRGDRQGRGFHVVYAVAAGLAYQLLDRSDTTSSR